MADLRTSRVALAQQLADKEGLLIRAQIKIQKMGQVVKTLSQASEYISSAPACSSLLPDGRFS
jgi:hypothetical protein